MLLENAFFDGICYFASDLVGNGFDTIYGVMGFIASNPIVDC